MCVMTYPAPTLIVIGVHVYAIETSEWKYESEKHEFWPHNISICDVPYNLFSRYPKKSSKFELLQQVKITQ